MGTIRKTGAGIVNEMENKSSKVNKCPFRVNSYTKDDAIPLCNFGTCSHILIPEDGDTLVCPCHKEVNKCKCIKHTDMSGENVLIVNGCPIHDEFSPTPDTKNYQGDLRWKDTKERVKREILFKDYDNWLDKNVHNLEIWTGKEWKALPDIIEGDEERT